MASHGCTPASLDAGTGHLQPEGLAKPVGGGPQEMALKRGLVLGAEWADREGDSAVAMSSLRTVLLPLSLQYSQGCLRETLGS